MSKGSNREVGLWVRFFACTVTDNSAWTQRIFAAGNFNFSPDQNELLLWHCCLSHAGLSTIHNLLQVKKNPPMQSADELVFLCYGYLLSCKYEPPSSVSHCQGLATLSFGPFLWGPGCRAALIFESWSHHSIVSAAITIYLQLLVMSLQFLVIALPSLVC